MPAKRGTSFFVTCTFPGGMDEKHISSVCDWVRNNCVRYFFVRETGSNGSNPHVHGFCVFNRELRTDKVKEMFQRCYAIGEMDNPDFRKRGVIVGIVTDEVTLIGGYFQKESDVKVLIKTPDFTDQVLDDFVEKAKVSFALHNVQRKSSGKQLTRGSAYSVIRKFIEDTGHPCSTEHEFAEVVIKMFKAGYDLSTVFRDLRSIYHCIRDVECSDVQGIHDAIFGRMMS